MLGDNEVLSSRHLRKALTLSAIQKIMKVALTILTVLISHLIYGQKQIEINDDQLSLNFYKNLEKTLKDYSLKNIQGSSGKTVRIWIGQEVFNFDNNPSYVRRFTNLETGLSYMYKQSIVSRLDSFNIAKFKYLNVTFTIDCRPVTAEIAENSDYFLKVLGCNEEIKTLISKIYKDEINSGIETFKKGLPSGEYTNNMITFSINQPITESSEKTNFYKKLEEELLKNNINIGNPESQPLIRLNSKKAYFEHINKLDESKVKSYKILTKEQGIVYGKSGQNGVLIIETE